MSNNATKLIYVKFNDNIECIELNQNTSTEDFKDTLRSIAECSTNDIIKLYNHKGYILNISIKLDANTKKEAYRLEVVVKSFDTSIDLGNLVQRIENLETNIFSSLPKINHKNVNNLLEKVNSLTTKLENVEHLSWLGLFKDTKFTQINNSLFNNQHVKIEKKVGKIKDVYEKFKAYTLSSVSAELRDYLKSPSFDNWQFDDAEMLLLVQQMFIDLDLVTKFAINIETLQEFLFEVYSNYNNNVPYHNFHHAFTVTQMMYSLIYLTDLTDTFDPLKILSLIVAAISHDLNHDGFNNAYQINACTPLAMIYNDRSPLEMYHCALAFSILTKERCNIIMSFNREMSKEFRENVIECILATDMTFHTSIINDFNKIVHEFDCKKRKHQLLLMKMLMKTADISNESRPLKVSQGWVDCLLTEFFNQGDHEKLNGLPLTPQMDRDKVLRNASQISFISVILLPLVKSIAQLFPKLNANLVEPIQESYNYYQRLDSKHNEAKT